MRSCCGPSWSSIRRGGRPVAPTEPCPQDIPADIVANERGGAQRCCAPTSPSLPCAPTSSNTFPPPRLRGGAGGGVKNANPDGAVHIIPPAWLRLRSAGGGDVGARHAVPLHKRPYKSPLPACGEGQGVGLKMRTPMVPFTSFPPRGFDYAQPAG